jgi:hypothetical protein
MFSHPHMLVNKHSCLTLCLCGASLVFPHLMFLFLCVRTLNKFSLDVGLDECRSTPDVIHSDRVVAHEFQDSSCEDVCINKVFFCFLKSLQGNVMGNGPCFRQPVCRMIP